MRKSERQREQVGRAPARAVVKRWKAASPLRSVLSMRKARVTPSGQEDGGAAFPEKLR